MLADFKNNKFHFYLGTFMIPMHVRAQLGNLYAEVKAYIMFGNDIPGFPSIDPRIASFLGISVDKRKTDAMNYQANVETGSGMLFGAGVDISFEDCKWFGVNIRVKANFLAGFDAGFLKFSDQKRCNNGSKFGIDQWYNMARFYLLINFEAGRFRKCEKRYSHWGNLNIGAFLEGQFPNPVYLEGKFVFRMCGFHINFKFKKGERCGL